MNPNIRMFSGHRHGLQLPEDAASDGSGRADLSRDRKNRSAVVRLRRGDTSESNLNYSSIYRRNRISV